MTHDEIDLFKKLGECFEDFDKLPKCRDEGFHETDPKDFEFHIHALQNIVLARSGLRQYLEQSKK